MNDFWKFAGNKVIMNIYCYNLIVKKYTIFTSIRGSKIVFGFTNNLLFREKTFLQIFLKNDWV